MELSKTEQERRDIDTALQAVDGILEYIVQMDQINNEDDLNKILPGVLEALGHYTLSDRSYLFDWLDDRHEAFRMTHEWCADGIKPTFCEMQCVPIDRMPNWISRMKSGETIFSHDWDADMKSNPEEYELFDGQNIHSLIVIPMFSNKKLSGWIGIDNPEQRTSALSVRLLSSLGGHIGSLKQNLNMFAALEEKQRLLESSLRELADERDMLDALSIDYTSVYYCDLIADTIEAIKQGASTNAALTDAALTEQKQIFSFRIRYYYDHFVIKESAPEFMKKLSAPYLMEFLSHNSRMAYRFRTKPNMMGQEYFEVQVVRLNTADGFKVVMGYRYIDDIVEEQERQKTKLENALAEANMNNEIISSISKIYSLIYRIDLTQGTYDEISAGQDLHRLTGKQGRINDAFAEVCEHIIAPEDKNSVMTFFDTSTLASRLHDTESVEIEYRTQSGSWQLARFIVKKRNADGKVTNVLYLVHEINKQKQIELNYQAQSLKAAEDARRANIAKTDFLRRMSHDIRTPINGIRGVVSIANHFPNDFAKQQECRDKIMQASGFLLDLVNNVLDMNKLESGSVVLENKPFDLMELLHESNSITDMQGQEKAITLRVINGKLYHTKLVGSPLHFRQVLLNIAGNAVKYNRPGGSIILTCDEIAFDSGRATFRLTCTDTGRGMSHEFVEHAFEPFSQEAFDARTAYMGTGLGLTIAKQLVELMGGTIQLESELGVGTKFTIIMPFAIDTEYENRQAEVANNNIADLTGVNVLLVEDNDLNMEIARFILEKAGMNVTSAWDGQEAVEKFAQSPQFQYDIILMDVMMPVMDGLDATRKIRAMKRPDAAKLPIFAMTANAFQDDIQRSYEAGMNEHLSKPLQEDEILRAISRYVRPADC